MFILQKSPKYGNFIGFDPSRLGRLSGTGSAPAPRPMDFPAFAQPRMQNGERCWVNLLLLGKPTAEEVNHGFVVKMMGWCRSGLLNNINY